MQTVLSDHSGKSINTTKIHNESNMLLWVWKLAQRIVLYRVVTILEYQDIKALLNCRSPDTE